MSALDIELVKAHIRVSHGLEDSLIQSYLQWAKSTVIESITTEDKADIEYLETNMQYQKAVVLLTGYFYEQRMPIGDVNPQELPYSVLDSIQKLRGNPKINKSDSNE